MNQNLSSVSNSLEHTFLSSSSNTKSMDKEVKEREEMKMEVKELQGDSTKETPISAKTRKDCFTSYCMDSLSPLESYLPKDSSHPSSTYSLITNRDCFSSKPKLFASQKQRNAFNDLLPFPRLKKINNQTASHLGVQLLVPNSPYCNRLLSHVRHWETKIQPLNSYAVSSEAFTLLLKNEEYKKRKSCTCKKFHCLKQYCECFAAKRKCEGCKCMDCYNNTKHSDIRQQLMNDIPKAKLHHCKGIKCTKKYCDCYQNNTLCNDNCTHKDSYNEGIPFI